MVLNCITIAIFVWNIFILFQAALLAKVCRCDLRKAEEEALSGRKGAFQKNINCVFCSLRGRIGPLSNLTMYG